MQRSGAAYAAAPLAQRRSGSPLFGDETFKGLKTAAWSRRTVAEYAPELNPATADGCRL
jgi:hypothetical protein